MRVELISHTADADKLSAAAAQGCTDPRPSDELFRGMDQNTAEIILDIVLPSGHHSVIEHTSFTFAVEGVSRSLTHQLVRHRIASYSQQSQRYVRFDDPDYITPGTIERSQGEEADTTGEELKPGESNNGKEIFDEAMKCAWDSYGKLVEMGIPAEDARYVLPNAATNNITITMNARSLIHFFSIRCCTRAQWEIRVLAKKMLELVKEAAPHIFKNAGASCDLRGYCPEFESCGRAPRLEDIKKAYAEKNAKE